MLSLALSSLALIEAVVFTDSTSKSKSVMTGSTTGAGVGSWALSANIKKGNKYIFYSFESLYKGILIKAGGACLDAIFNASAVALLIEEEAFIYDDDLVSQ